MFYSAQTFFESKEIHLKVLIFIFTNGNAFSDLWPRFLLYNGRYILSIGCHFFSYLKKSVLGQVKEQERASQSYRSYLRISTKTFGSYIWLER